MRRTPQVLKIEYERDILTNVKVVKSLLRNMFKMWSCCGNLGGSDIYTCQKCHMTIDRDINGARNIYVKSLLLKTNVIW